MPLDNQIFATCEIVKIVANRGHQQIPFPEFNDNLNGKIWTAPNVEITRPGCYIPDPLLSLDKLASHCGVRSVVYKDESKRLGMKSFKAWWCLCRCQSCCQAGGNAGVDPKISQ